MTSSMYFGTRSLSLLDTVKPPLKEVAMLALKLSDIDFGVVQGKRTKEQQARLYGQGRTAADMRRKGLPEVYANPTLPKVTWTMSSNHLGGDAIDVCPWVGSWEWDNNGRLGYWPRVARAFEAASNQTCIPVYWGGLWTRPDRPHFSLVPG